LVMVGCGDATDTYLDVLDMSASVKGDGGALAGLPCDVSQVLASRCLSCHSAPPNGSPLSLASYADLTAISSADPNKKVIERAVMRMQDPARPMPPTGVSAAADVSVLQGWINAGLPMGSCMGSDPYKTPLVCTSGQSWTGGNKGSSSMYPGRACITCHSTVGDAPKFQIAGTVYPTAHEPDSCLGTNAGGAITVEITDSVGTVVNLNANSSGNFSFRSRTAPLKFPYTAKVKQGTKVRAMTASQNNGDCNSCHTQDGKSGAPGRVMAP
jgi:cytochrome c553